MSARSLTGTGCRFTYPAEAGALGTYLRSNGPGALPNWENAVGPAPTLVVGEVDAVAFPGPPTFTLTPGEEAGEYIVDVGAVTGEQGPPGETGAAATIAVGVVNTLDPGEPATVEDVGEPGAAVFNFGLPRGATGDPPTFLAGEASVVPYGDPPAINLSEEPANVYTVNIDVPAGQPAANYNNTVTLGTFVVDDTNPKVYNMPAIATEVVEVFAVMGGDANAVQTIHIVADGKTLAATGDIQLTNATKGQRVTSTHYFKGEVAPPTALILPPSAVITSTPTPGNPPNSGPYHLYLTYKVV